MPDLDRPELLLTLQAQDAAIKRAEDRGALPKRKLLSARAKVREAVGKVEIGYAVVTDLAEADERAERMG